MNLRQILRTPTILPLTAGFAALFSAIPVSAQEPVPFRTLEADTVTVGYPVYRSKDHGLRLREITESAELTQNIDTAGISVFDADADGSLDVLLHANLRAFASTPSRLHLNDGRGRFRAVAAFSDSIYFEIAVAADLDNDGQLDLAGLEDTNWTGVDTKAPFVLLNTGEARFQRIPLPLDDAGLWRPWSIAVGDVDLDGHHDLVFVEIAADRSECRLALDRGLGDGRFRRVQTIDLRFRPAPWQKSNRSRLALGNVILWDDDHDGDLDAHVLNAMGYWSGQPETLVHRNDDGRFRQDAERHHELFPAHGGQSRVLADFDRDLRLDVFHGIDDYRGGRNQLLLSQSDGSWRSMGADSGLWAGYAYTAACVAGDLDADGWLDLVQARHRSEGRPASQDVYRNVGGSRFELCSGLLPAGLQMVSRAAVTFDADGDLDLDLLLAGSNQQRDLVEGVDLVDRFFLQTAPTGSAIAFRLRGTDSPRDGRDSRIEVHTADGWQLRVVGQGGVTGSSNPPLVQHFGLGTAKSVDEVRVRWTSGRVEEFGSFTAGAVHTLVEGEGRSGSR